MTHRRGMSVACVIVVVGSICTGCGGEVSETYPVTGRVSWADGAAATDLAESTIELQSADAVSQRFSPRGEVHADASFSLQTHAKEDGAPAGSYRVIVMPKLVLDTKARPTRPIVAAKYQSYKTTPLKVEVKPEANEVTLTLERIR